MTRFLFAVPVLALSAAVGLADAPASGGSVTPAPAAPVVGPVVAPTYSSAPATTRRGLLGRLRNRNTVRYSSAPLMAAPAPAPIITPPQTPAPAPAPMPGVKPAGAMMPMSGQVVQATGNLPPGVYTTTDGTVVQVGGTQAAMQTQPQSQSTRRGLLSRLRNR
jgi:hypothetical protein